MRNLVRFLVAMLLLMSTDAIAAVFMVTANADAGEGSLRQAVLDANSSPGADEINFSPDLGSIELTSGQIDITETLSIIGPIDRQTISGGQNSRVFGVTVDNAPLRLENLVIMDGSTVAEGQPTASCLAGTGEGGGICSKSDLALVNTEVSDCVTQGQEAFGGGVFVWNANLELSSSEITDNQTLGLGAIGGGIAVLSGDFLMEESLVNGNMTSSQAGGGAGIAIANSAMLPRFSVIIRQSSITNNLAQGPYSRGGGLRVNNAVVEVEHVVVSGNSTEGDGGEGGGLFAFNALLELNDSDISDNSTDGHDASGGGIFVSIAEELRILNCTVSGNSTKGTASSGGGLYAYAYEGEANVINSTFTGNSTENSGSTGGALIIESGDATVANSTIVNNSTYRGPSIYLEARTRDAEVLSSIIAANILHPDNPIPTAGNIIGNTGPYDLNVRYSLFGDEESEIDGENTQNIFTDQPQLEELADNGCTLTAGFPSNGECVKTYAYLEDSPAKDNGANPLALATDARGTDFLRVAGIQADIGAFEGPADGECSGEDGANLRNAPTELCAIGESTGVEGTGPWSWSCLGQNYGADTSCQANLVIDGQCGSDDGQTLEQPPTNLCEAGEPGPVLGSGPWRWTCMGLNDGESVTCGASLKFKINAGLNDAWIADGAPYQGLFLTVYPDMEAVAAAWFTFDTVPVDGENTAIFGGSNQRWVTALGFYDTNTVVMNAELTSGGRFNTSVPLAEQDVDYGAITIEFIDCESATVTYSFPQAGLSGSFEITRVLDTNVALCELLSE